MFGSMKWKVSSLIVISLLASLSWPQTSEHAAAKDSYDQLREKWVVRLVGSSTLQNTDPDLKSLNQGLAGEVSNSRRMGIYDRMHKNGNRTSLWPDLTKWSSDPLYSGDIYTAYSRLKSMALAYASKGSPLYHHEGLKNSILGGLDWMYANRYNEGVTPTPRSNWWDWQIGIPTLFNDTVALMYSDLRNDQIIKYMRAIDKFCPDPTLQYDMRQEETGANRVDKARIVMLKGMLQKNGSEIARGRAALDQVFRYVTSGDGFYKDGSFIQHEDIAYTGGYGYVLLDHLADAMYLLRGSEWSVEETNIEYVYQWIMKSFIPVMYNGAMMDMVRGRNISRQGWQDFYIGREVTMAILRISEVTSPAESGILKRIVKGFVLQNKKYGNSYAGLDIFHISRLKLIMKDTRIMAYAKPVQSYVFASMDRFVQQRRDFAFSVSMMSERIANFEKINNENLKGWNTGEGMTYLYNGDLSQYNGSYWPTVDPYRLPGITSDGTTQNPDKTNGQSWVGGVTLGQYGAVGMAFENGDGSLTGKKSWFTFDDEIVALGAGITGTSGRKAETIVENRKLNASGTNKLTVNGVVEPSNLTWRSNLGGVHWAHLQGSSIGSDIGYYFPGGSNVQAKREKRTGSWNKIGSGGSGSSVSSSYLSLAIPHGSSPNGAGYAYVILPNKSAPATATYNAHPDIAILSNTPVLQAVREQKLGVTGYNFWEPGAYGPLSVDAPASILYQESGGNLLLAVSDPTQKRVQMTVELNIAGAQVVSIDDAMQVLQTAPTLKLLVNTADAHGRKIFVKIKH